MSARQEAVSQYANALKQGRKSYKEALVRGRYPYPQVLDEILDEHMVTGRVDMGVIEVPTEQVVGTKSAGRRSAFASDFMPLLDMDTEFAPEVDGPVRGPSGGRGHPGPHPVL